MTLSRSELVALLDAYADALAARSPRRLPGAQTLRFTENGQTLALGTGLWATVTSVAPRYSAFVDFVTGQAVAYHAVEENGVGATIMVRLRADEDGIGEIETIVCRTRAFLFDPASMYQPSPIIRAIEAERRSDRAFLGQVPYSYFDGIVAGNAASIPLAVDAVRIECGVQVTCAVPSAERATQRGFDLFAMGVAEQIDSGFFSFVTDIADRRVVVVDEEQSVAVAIARFDFAGTVTEYSMPGQGQRRTEPYYLAPRGILICEAFQVENGLIRSVEAAFEPCFFGMKTGWEA